MVYRHPGFMYCLCFMLTRDSNIATGFFPGVTTLSLRTFLSTCDGQLNYMSLTVSERIHHTTFTFLKIELPKEGKGG